ncbi:hypothetical protein ABPG74_019925 [Tetrahymena malaccensis]
MKLLLPLEEFLAVSPNECIEISLKLNQSSTNKTNLQELARKWKEYQSVKVLNLYLPSTQIKQEDTFLLASGISILSNLISLEISLQQIKNQFLQKFGHAGGSLIILVQKAYFHYLLPYIISIIQRSQIFSCSNFYYSDIQNSIGNKGVSHLSLSLSQCFLLQNLGLYLKQLQNLILEYAFNKQYYNQLKSSNNIEDEGLCNLQQLSSCEQLKYLVLFLDNNQIGSQKDDASNLALAIIKIKSLQQLNLSMAQNNVGPQIILQLSAAVKMNQSINTLELNLNDNLIGDEGVESMASEIIKWENIQNLELNLNFNWLRNKSVSCLSKSLGKQEKLENLLISLQDNQIEDESLQELGKELSKLQNLKCLNIMLNNSQQGLCNLISQISINNNIQKLNLSSCSDMLEDTSLNYIGKELQKCKNLQYLTIQFTSDAITDAGVQNLVKKISGCENLKDLSIQIISDSIEGQQLRQLSNYFSKIKNLNCLDFQIVSSNMDNQSCHQLKKDLKKIESLILLQLSF